MSFSSQDERQESSDDEMLRSEREMKGRRFEEDDRFSPPQRLNGRYSSEVEGERHLQQATGLGGHSSEDEEALHPPRTREMRRLPSEDIEEDEAPLPHVRDKRRYTIEDKRDTVPMKVRAKRRGAYEDEEVRHLKERRDTSESQSEDEERHVRKKRRDNSKDGPERGSPAVRSKRRYISEDEGERQPPQSKEKRRHTSDEDESLSSDFTGKKADISKGVGRNIHAPEASADQEMYNPLTVCMIHCAISCYLVFLNVIFLFSSAFVYMHGC